MEVGTATLNLLLQPTLASGRLSATFRPLMSALRQLSKVALPIVISLTPALSPAGEAWVTSITTSSNWAVFPCKNYLVTNVCGTDKDYADSGALPPIVSVGDTITYSDKEGKRKQFVIRHIRLFVFEKDVDFTSAGKRYTARKGETTCSLYDVTSRAATRDTEYPSKIVINGCRSR